MTRSRGTVLVLRALGLGDLLTAVPALRAVRDAFPDDRLVVATSAWVAPLAEHARLADEILPAGELEPIDGRGADGADVAVDLHGRGPQSHRVLLATQPHRLVAFAHPDVEESRNLPEWRAGEHEVTRWCRLLDECGIPADPARLDVDPPRDVVAPAVAEGATVVHPGASATERHWPLDRWAGVARAEVAAGRRVVVTGSRAEVPLARAVVHAAGLGDGANLAGRTSLLELAAVVARAGRLVSGDTGIAHLATAFGTPSVVLFGPVPPTEWGPPPDRTQHRPLWAGRPDPGMRAIAVNDVIAALERLPERAAA